MNKGGRPRKYNSAKSLQDAVDKYFEECFKPRFLKDEEGSIIRDKKGNPIYLGEKPPTVSGLAYYLGFASTQSLMDYEKDERFSLIIRRAKLQIEEYLEGRLMDRDGQRGAEFNLRCNFKWNDKQDDSNTSDITNTGLIMIAPVLQEDTDKEEMKDVRSIQN